MSEPAGIKIQINSKAALERLLGLDQDTSLLDMEIRNSAVAAVVDQAKQRIGLDAIVKSELDAAQKEVAKLTANIRKEVWDEFFRLQSDRWRTYPVLRDDQSDAIKKGIKADIESVISEEIRNQLSELNLKEVIAGKVDEAVKNITAPITEAVICKRIKDKLGV